MSAGRFAAGRRLLLAILCALVCALSTGCRGARSSDGGLQVRGGPTLAGLFDALATAYAGQPSAVEVECNFTCPPCVLLQQQVKDIDFDVIAVVGADTVDAYVKHGLVQRDTAQQFGTTRLVLVTSARRPAPLQSVEDLRNPDIDPIALADPELLGPGIVAKRALQKLDLWESLQPRLAIQETGCAAVKMASLGAASAAIICEFCLHDDGGTGGGLGDLQLVAPLPDESEPQVELHAALMSGSGQSAAARQFIDFLLTPAAQEIIAAHGITPVGDG